MRMSHTGIISRIGLRSLFMTMLLLLAAPAQASTEFCSPNRNIPPLPNTQSGSFGSTDPVCFVIQHDGPLEFNCSNLEGRSVLVNGVEYAAEECESESGNSVNVANTNGGEYYFDVSSGGLSYASIAFWEGTPSSLQEGSELIELFPSQPCEATVTLGQVWSDRFNLHVSVNNSNTWRMTMSYSDTQEMIATWNIDPDWPESNRLVAVPNRNGNDWGVTIKHNGDWTWPSISCESNLRATLTASRSIPNETLAADAKAHGLYFGATADNPQASAALEDAILGHFTAITSENNAKWDTIAPNDGQFNFDAFNAVARWANNHSPMALRAHAPVWSKQLPDWVADYDDDPSGMEEVITRHVTRILQEAAAQDWNLYAYDVVNEVFMPDGQRRPPGFWDRNFENDESPFEAALPGPHYDPAGTNYTETDWVYIAFKTAREVLNGWGDAPKPLLCYNDFEIENINTKSDAVYDLIQWLNSEEKLVDCIGMQAHFRQDTAGGVPRDDHRGVTANMRRFADLGLVIQVTELDARESLTTVSQDDAFRIVTEACLRTPACAGISQWGVRDRDSWIDRDQPEEDREFPLLLDDNYQRKPVYETVRDVLQMDRVTLLPGANGFLVASGFDIACDGRQSTACAEIFAESRAVQAELQCLSGTTPGQWFGRGIGIGFCGFGDTSCGVITELESYLQPTCE